MERELEADAAVLGVDEHTAVLIDLRAEDIEIRGRGGVTVRRSGDSVVLPSGTRLSVADLRDLVRGIRRAREGARARPGTRLAGQPAGTRASGEGGGVHGRNADEMSICRCLRSWRRPNGGSGRPCGARDADAMVAVILELRPRSRSGRPTRTRTRAPSRRARCCAASSAGLGRAARDGLADPRDRLRPAVEPLLALRAALRGEGNFAAADAIREALAAAGLDVSDTPEGTRWRPTETVLPADGWPGLIAVDC